ncbi:1,4-dihydroxy-6-naphthoate synthase [Thermoactinomyces sp. DSM 45891]|uniref:1,4-dihydroxy-6-naphthoate synthase n=1 Tax=Thermoactinomyces sp. DSM 45891 TaxID=1761907 RepID=UPI00091F6D8B|nr:1,4-dihydroxy-6-naphthoate synthase [Thermoactinomyces sp. DSM 45891]SFX64270.1 1,4-dihydroxy-6-naphthoate synthase [Thermoactinomyces sp. DSM 45891]
MKIVFSPCPNDTFIFHAWVHGLIAGAPELDVTYADIDKTNTWASESTTYDLLKISCAALPWIRPEYTLLPCGGALGRGCGPLVLVNSQHKEVGSSSLSGTRVAVPSKRSTAYLLFRLWIAGHVPGGVGEIVVMPFHEIMPAVRDGLVDAGLVIHEARFTYPTFGLQLVKDLGEWWEEDTGLPIPLGAILARRDLDIRGITSTIRQSVQYAWEHPEASQEYILQLAQEMDIEVAQAHINLYVNEFSANLGLEGYQAIEVLLGRAEKEGLVPEMPSHLFHPFYP